MVGTVLVLGAHGRFGRNAAEAFWNAGWAVRSFDRRTDVLAEAAQGVDVIVNAWNPPYPDWAREVPRLTAQVIAAAQATGAAVLIPGNVYVFGQEAPSIFDETTPHAARNPLGRIRIEMEQAYRDAGVRTIVLRAGDFLDTAPSGNWFDRIMIQKLARGRFTYPGDPNVPHAWAYLPDMAAAAVTLSEDRADLPLFADIPFPGYTLTGQDLARALSRVTGQEVRLTRMPWWPMHLARPFWNMAAPLTEMSYLWRKPHALSPDRFDALLPEFRATPLDTAVARAIAHVEMPTKGAQRTTVQA